MLHDNMDYTPYEGMEVTGWPRTVINRGRIVVTNERLQVERGSGEFLEREAISPKGWKSNTKEPLSSDHNFGADLI